MASGSAISALIIEHLKRTRDVDPDAHLNAEQRAVARAIGLMLEEHLYFAVAYSRWVDEANWPLVRDAFFGSIPALFRPVVTGMIRRGVRGKVAKQGMGRHAPAEIDALGMADIDALAAYLGDKPYVMGEQPSLVDCIAHGTVCNLVRVPFTGALVERARSQANLVAYDQRMMARFFADQPSRIGLAA